MSRLGRSWPLFVLLCLGGWVVFNSAQAEPADLNAFADNLGRTVIDTVSDASLSEEQKESRLHQLFSENVDVDWIGRFVLGRHWRTASEEQKMSYQTYYREFLINYYVSKFREYHGESFKVLGVQEDSDGNYLLSMEIVRPKEGNVLIDYKVHGMGDSSFRIFDIIVEGVSLITTQRSEFNSVVARNGLDYLISKLEKKSKQPVTAATKTPTPAM